MFSIDALEPQALRDNVGRVAAAPAPRWRAEDDGVQGQEPLQGSGELLLRARAGGVLDARQHIDLCVRVSSDASVRHVEEHGVGIDGALEDGEVVDGVPAYE